MRLIILLLLLPLSTFGQETRTSLGFNVFGGYSGVQYLNDISVEFAKQYDSGIAIFRVNTFFEYALTEKRKAHITWGFGFDQSGYSNSQPTPYIDRQVYRQYYLYLPVAFKYKWTNSFYTSFGMAGGALIESRYIFTYGNEKSRGNHAFNYNNFQLSSTLSFGYEIPMKKNRVLFFEGAGAYNWLGKLTNEAAQDYTQRSAWQTGMSIGLMKRF